MQSNFAKIGYKVFPKLESTNATAKEMAKKDYDPVWVLALEQTSGRGRQGRDWLSEKGNFCASLLYYPRLLLNEMPKISFVAALAFYDAVIEVGVSRKKLLVKWPNDLLIRNKKVGGVLIETSDFKGSRGVPLIVGFGLNLVSSPKLHKLRRGSLLASSLKQEINNIPSSEEFLRLLIETYEFWDSFLIKHGFDNLRKEFLLRTCKVGSKILVRLPRKTVSGSFLDVDLSGALILECDNKVVSISAGDVHLIGA